MIATKITVRKTSFATQLEEISDLVAIIYRENYYNLESENNPTEIIIRKNNFSSLGSFELNFGYLFF